MVNVVAVCRRWSTTECVPPPSQFRNYLYFIGHSSKAYQYFCDVKSFSLPINTRYRIFSTPTHMTWHTLIPLRVHENYPSAACTWWNLLQLYLVEIALPRTAAIHTNTDARHRQTNFMIQWFTSPTWFNFIQRSRMVAGPRLKWVNKQCAAQPPLKESA